ncbi:hypothetical protein B566_EDAN004648, partial [Ephemera danica]
MARFYAVSLALVALAAISCAQELRAKRGIFGGGGGGG